MSISSMISNFKKLNFCNFFPHFPLLVRPCVFPIQRASSHTASPIKIPCISPIHLLFQGGSFATTSPQQFSHIPLVFFPFQSIRQAEFIPKTRRFRSKLKPFRGESSPARGRREGLFRGISEYFGSKNQPRSGMFGGKTGENFSDFAAVESP